MNFRVWSIASLYPLISYLQHMSRTQMGSCVAYLAIATQFFPTMATTAPPLYSRIDCDVMIARRVNDDQRGKKSEKGLMNE